VAQITGCATCTRSAPKAPFLRHLHRSAAEIGAAHDLHVQVAQIEDAEMQIEAGQMPRERQIC
jgi:hypothetical protein